MPRLTSGANTTEERLQKILARAGFGSRRFCEQLIREGRVTVNGQVIRELGSKAVAQKDRIRVNGQPLVLETEKVYLMLHKPAGYVTTLHDPEGRKKAIDLFPREKLPRIFPVGRLDYQSEGLLLFTNDGNLMQTLLHPSKEITKVYQAKVKGKISETERRKLSQGITLPEGKTLPARVKFLKAAEKNSWIEMEIKEGRYRQIRRMCEQIGHPVLRLIRVALGPLNLGNLKVGAFRSLTSKEVKTLKEYRAKLFD